MDKLFLRFKVVIISFVIVIGDALIYTR